MSDARHSNGRFAPGNSGGPGRPRRAVEHDYLATLGDAVPLDDWREIISRAVADAKKGDARARDWVTKHLIGSDPPKLVDLAAREKTRCNCRWTRTRPSKQASERRTMGHSNQSLNQRSHNAINAQRALSQLMPALERVATTPENFSAKERLTIVRLLEAALLADNSQLSIRAAEVGIAMEGENQRRGQELWPTGE